MRANEGLRRFVATALIARLSRRTVRLDNVIDVVIVARPAHGIRRVCNLLRPGMRLKEGRHMCDTSVAGNRTSECRLRHWAFARLSKIQGLCPFPGLHPKDVAAFRQMAVCRPTGTHVRVFGQGKWVQQEVSWPWGLVAES